MWNSNNLPGGCRDYIVQYICPKTPTCNKGGEQLTAREEELIAEVEDYPVGDFDLPDEVSDSETTGQEVPMPEGETVEKDLVIEDLLRTLLIGKMSKNNNCECVYRRRSHVM